MYKQALEPITVSDELRERILRTAERPVRRNNWVRPLCSAAACLVLCAVGVWGAGQLDSMGGRKDEMMLLDSATTGTAAAGGTSPKESANTKSEIGHTADTTAGSDEAPAAASEAYSAGGDSDSDGMQTEAGNPLKQFDSLEKAAAMLSYEPVLPAEYDEATLEVTVIGGEILQLDWETDGVFYTYRNALGADDISGVYRSWAATEEAEIAGNTVTLMGDGEEISLALWQADDLTFSLYAEPGTDRETVEEILE